MEEPPPYKEFGNMLREYRLNADLSQEQVAGECYKDHANPPSQRDLSNYEAGKTLPRLQKLSALVDVLHITQRELMALVRLAELRNSNVKRLRKTG